MNASAVELPRSLNMCVVDGVTAAVPIVSADVGPPDPIIHI